MTQWVKDAWDKFDYKTDNCLLNIKVSVCAKCAGLPSRSPDTHCQPSALERACWPGPLPGTHVALWNSAMETSPSQTCYLIGTRLWSVGQWRYFLFSSSRLSPSPSPWSPALVTRLQSSLCSWGSLGDWEESLLLVSQVSNGGSDRHGSVKELSLRHFFLEKNPVWALYSGAVSGRAWWNNPIVPKLCSEHWRLSWGGSPGHSSQHTASSALMLQTTPPSAPSISGPLALLLPFLLKNKKLVLTLNVGFLLLYFLLIIFTPLASGHVLRVCVAQVDISRHAPHIT